MDTLLQVLFLYACENRVAYSHEDRLKNRQSACAAERAKKELIKMLSKKEQDRLHTYIKAENALQLLELESMFRAGLAIGLELSQLQ